ncbi:chemotaxis protein CheW [Sphingomonas faeni]|uniref:chemotaxis protein CheW n=1 Tax=Sphingomonas faeni TaxID=185950 RepID=UPI002788866D|nr:chemotaxis protein CheW [Sphingomonas faeni]MDQ0836910.1 chemotaxis signal transduction protein [Sphingomonas faeni]
MTELFLVPHIAGRGVAVAAAQVDPVVDIGEIVAVPLAGAFVRGLAALRSRVVTVIDTGTALGLTPTSETVRRAVITVTEGHHCASWSTRSRTWRRSCRYRCPRVWRWTAGGPTPGSAS